MSNNYLFAFFFLDFFKIQFIYPSTVINAFFLERVSHTIRFCVMAVMTLGGLLTIAASVAFTDHFLLCLVGIALVGSANSFGESVALGFLNRFPAEQVNAWSSGTGMAGRDDPLFAFCLDQTKSRC